MPMGGGVLPGVKVPSNLKYGCQVDLAQAKVLSPERMRQEAITWYNLPSEVTLDLLLLLSSGRTKQSFVPAAQGWLL